MSAHVIKRLGSRAEYLASGADGESDRRSCAVELAALAIAFVATVVCSTGALGWYWPFGDHAADDGRDRRDGVASGWNVSSLVTPPLFAALSKARRVLIAGAGGGFDVYAGLPLAIALWDADVEVYLANLSLPDRTPRPGRVARRERRRG